MTQGTYWTSIQNSHAEIKIIGSNQYLIERGDGYELIRGIESLVALSQQEVNEFLSILDRFSKETQAIRKVGSKLVQYYRLPNRQNVALRASGYLYKHHGVPQQLTFDLIEYLIDVTADDEPQMRYQAVRDTYSKDANTDQVSGYTKFLESVNGDESVILTIQKEFGKLGYYSNGNGSGSSAKPGRTQKPEVKRFEYVQKYSNDSLLAEAIIIEGKPCFAVVYTEGGRITLEEEIPLNDSRNTVLKAPDTSSYINKPYSFASVTEFEDYIEKARNETLDSFTER